MQRLLSGGFADGTDVVFSGGLNEYQGVVADRSRLQEGYRSMCIGKGKLQGARKRAGS